MGAAVFAIAIAAAVAGGPAAAIVGGKVESGPDARSALMVLGAKGGVCSAVVVAPDALLTAAHCVTGASDYRVHYRDARGEPVLLEPAAIAIHPGYDRGAIAGRRRSIDLALVRLAAPLPPPFEPAVLSDANPAQGETVAIGGFGLAEPGVARTTGTYRSVDLPVIAPYGRSTILLWAGGRPGAGACGGDSGGPIRSGDAVFAVSSWATGKAGCGDISQGVLLGPQRAWLDGILTRWGRRAAWR